MIKIVVSLHDADYLENNFYFSYIRSNNVKDDRFETSNNIIFTNNFETIFKQSVRIPVVVFKEL